MSLLAGAAVTSALAALAAAGAAVPPPLPQWTRGERLCTPRQPALAEASGIAGSLRRPGVLFAVSDDAATVVALDGRCRTLATIEPLGAAGRDVEDLAAARDVQGRASLWIADIGDNDAVRDAIAVHRIDEPALAARPPAAGAPVLRPAAETIRLRYPDGAHDAEALLVLDGGRRLAIVTKSATGAATVYEARVPVQGAGGDRRLRRVTTLEPPPSLGHSLLALSPAITGGAVSPDRRVVVLRTYGDAYAWARAPGEPLREMLAREPERIRLPSERQGEAIGFAARGRRLLVGSEGPGEPVWALQRKARASPR